MTYADMLREEGKKRGIERGLQLAAERAHQAYVTSLTTLLEARFGPLPAWATARVESLDEQAILACIARSVSAPSLDALLGPTAPQGIRS